MMAGTGMESLGLTRGRLFTRAVDQRPHAPDVLQSRVFQDDFAHQAVTVRVQATAGQTEDDVAGPNGTAVDDVLLFDDADAEAPGPAARAPSRWQCSSPSSGPRVGWNIHKGPKRSATRLEPRRFLPRSAVLSF
jgi:hypothetical protein